MIIPCEEGNFFFSLSKYSYVTWNTSGWTRKSACFDLVEDDMRVSSFKLDDVQDWVFM